MSCEVIHVRARSKEVGPVMPLLFAFYGLNLSGMWNGLYRQTS